MPRSYSMGNRSAATASTRTRILDAAVEVLAEVGAAGLTMPGVAERADVALRTVYNHFSSREQLVVDAYERLAQSSIDAVARIAPGGAPRERLGQFLEAFYDCFEDEGPGAAAILSVTDVPEFDSRLAEVRAWRRRELGAIVRAAHQDGSLRIPVKAATAVAFLVTAYATWHSFVNESGLTPPAAKELGRRVLDSTLFGVA